MRALRGARWILAVWALGGAGCDGCLDLKPQAYPCDPDGGANPAQCAAGWRCGLAGRCHATGPDAGAPYACISDLDCEAGWRCSATQFCADPTGELISGAEYEGPLTVDVLNPLILPGPPSLFSALNVKLSGGPSTIYLTLLDGGILDDTVITLPPDGGPATRTESQLTVGAATALEATGINHAFVLVDGGLLSQGFNGIASWFLPVNGALGLRHVDPGGQAAVLISDAGYLLAGTLPSTVQALNLGGACAGDSVLDLQMVLASGPPGTPIPGRACLLAVSPSGVFYANYDSTGQFMAPSDGGSDAGPISSALPSWAQFAGLPGGGCGVPPGAQQAQALFPSNVGLGVALTENGQTEAALVSYDGLTNDAGVWLGCTPDQACCGRLGPIAIRACPVCAGQRLAEVRPVAVAPTPVMDVRCVDDSSGQSFWFQIHTGQVGGGCDEPFPLFTQASLYIDDVVYDAALPQAPTYAGAHGEIWLGSNNRLDETPYLLDEVPLFVLERDAGVQVSGLSRIFDDTGTNVEVQDLWGFVPGVGMLLDQQRTGIAELEGAVQGQPSWAIEQGLDVRDLDAVPGFDIVATPGGTFSPGLPYIGRVVATPAGGFELVVASFDTIYSADVTARVSGTLVPTPERLKLRLVPLAGNAFQSLVMIPPDGGVLRDAAGNPAFAHGYAVTQEQVFEVVASSEVEWHVNPIPVPAGQPHSVWHEGDRARVGLVDGRVYSLPSLVPLAPALPEPSPVASGFQQMCEQGYALGGLGVYRLVADATGGTGHWVALDGGAMLSADSFPTTGVLRAIGNHLYVANSYGGLVRFTANAQCN